ncbi:Hypothetical_protein [Hexamita inflata]|uniref:Hypothetical_protein n=1 Tax=Hexamita inflata TaxID=28002 RepID=A0AA86TN50_9EUKA|nr:Hypothetical protein HINF_LOCUS10005 [Hexamita inflata]
MPPIERKVSSKGNLEQERGQITCLLLTQNRKPSKAQKNESLEEAPNGISKIVYLTIENQERYQRSQTLGKSQSTTGNILRNQEFAKTNKLRRTPGTQSSQ